MFEESLNNPAAQIREAAIRLLSRREHSQVELIRKLTQKGFDENDCNLEVLRLKEQGYQSDTRFAQMFVRARAAKFYGPGRVRDELKQHQLVGQDIQAALAESDIDWFELCQQAMARKFRQGVAQDWQARQKQKRYLWQRGFSEDQIQYALSANDDS